MNSVNCNGTAVTPSKIICIGRNYVAHAKELGNAVPTQPVIFIKPNSAIGDALHSGSDEPNHYESEICFMVKEGGLAAVGFGLDLTKRKTQTKLKDAGLPWERAKAFDGAAVFSEFISLGQYDLNGLSLRLDIDGKCKQTGGVDMMLFKPFDILEEVTSFLTLEDGDIIMTGTPAGVGEVKPGSQYVGKILLNGNDLVQGEWLAQ